MNPLHLLWIIPLTATFSIGVMAILIVGSDSERDFKIIPHDDIDIPNPKNIVGCHFDEPGLPGPSGKWKD